MKKLIFVLFGFVFSLNGFSQVVSLSGFEVDYTYPVEYEIGGIAVSGVKYLDPDIIISLTGLKVGDKVKIPGEKFAKAVQKLWKQGLFSDVKIVVSKQVGNTVFLDIQLKERQRLSAFSFDGIRKGEADDLREELKLSRGKQVTENILNNAKNIIRNYFIDKGFLYVTVDVVKDDDPKFDNYVILTFKVNKGPRIKINEINFEGNTVFTDNQLRRAMKETKVKKFYRIFKSSKFIEKDYKEDLKKVIDKYNEHGYRDAKIIKDTVYRVAEKLINIDIALYEGKQYYFRNITWKGNTKYNSKLLTQLLGIKKGDVYNKKLLDENLYMNPNGVFSLYQDNGYLFSSITPIETQVEGDSIDIEIQIYEGKKAKINRVTVVGNTKTHDHVILREIRTLPGDMYNRSKIIRTQRELATLGYFNPEKLNVNPTPDPTTGTVDLQYEVEEKLSDQIEMSVGWGAQMFVGTLGLILNNFSLRNMFKKEGWKPLPSGDGQRLTIRAQSNGYYYQGYSLSFVEPWLGGKKPNSLTVSLYHSVYSNGLFNIPEEKKQYMKITGAAVGLGRRLKLPDDFFTLYNEVNYQLYNLHNYHYYNLFSYNDGRANNLSFTTVFGRNSVDQPIYPRRGSTFSLSLKLTPPYSFFNKGVDYANLPDQEKYKWIEYHKWKLKAIWYTRLVENLVLETKGEFGYLGYYNSKIGYSPFEGFNMGGDGLMTYNIYGMETIALRGYENGSLTPKGGGHIYNKFLMELRYPLSLNPQATFYVLGFAAAGNAWSEFSNYDPFKVYRSAGVGIRAFLPMMGKIGVDWGYGFDPVPGNPSANGSQFHFIIGQEF